MAGCGGVTGNPGGGVCSIMYLSCVFHFYWTFLYWFTKEPLNTSYFYTLFSKFVYIYSSQVFSLIVIFVVHGVNMFLHNCSVKDLDDSILKLDDLSDELCHYQCLHLFQCLYFQVLKSIWTVLSSGVICVTP